MRKSKYTEAQIVGMLREHEAGKKIGDICREHGISQPTFYNWKSKNGGLDANWLDKHGVPTITIGSGQAEIHTIKEYVNLAEFEKGCRIGVLMATLDD